MALAKSSKEGRPQYAGRRGGWHRTFVYSTVLCIFFWVNVMVDMFMNSSRKSFLGHQWRLQNLYAVPTFPPLPEVTKLAQIKTKLTSKVPKCTRRKVGPGLQCTHLGRMSSCRELPVSTHIHTRKQYLPLQTSLREHPHIWIKSIIFLLSTVCTFMVMHWSLLLSIWLWRPSLWFCGKECLLAVQRICYGISGKRTFNTWLKKQKSWEEAWQMSLFSYQVTLTVLESELFPK